MKETDKAFPLHAENHAGYFFPGLTVRDYIAIQAMVGLIAQGSGLIEPYDETAKAAYMIADAMIKRSEVK